MKGKAIWRAALAVTAATMLVMMLTACATTARSPRGYTRAGDFTWRLDGPHQRIMSRWTSTSGPTIRITGYTGRSTNVRIPPYIETGPGTRIPVTLFADGAFEGRGLTSVTIPNTVVSIGANAFANNRLTGVEIPSSVRSIGDRAFYNNQLANVRIPDGVNRIGNRAFAGNQIRNMPIRFARSVFADDDPLGQIVPSANIGPVGSMSAGEIAATLGLSGLPARPAGNTPADAVAWRNAWVNVLNRTRNYIWNNPPTLARVTYMTNIRQSGVNFANSTVRVYFDYAVQALQPIDHLRLINGVNRELQATGRHRAWELNLLPDSAAWANINTNHFGVSASVHAGNGSRFGAGSASGRAAGRPHTYMIMPANAYVDVTGIGVRVGTLVAQVPVSALDGLSISMGAGFGIGSMGAYASTPVATTNWMRQLPIEIVRVQ